MKIKVIAAIALVAFAAPGLATAQLAPVNPDVAVRYNDLDLQNTLDAKAMLHRIREAAAEVCQPAEAGFGATVGFEACYRKTVDEAVAKLDAPGVTAALNSTGDGRKLAKLH